MTEERWAIVEIMGHRVRAGRISEVEAFGTKLLRVEIPLTAGGFVTEDYGGPAIFCITPATEEAARKRADQQQASSWDRPTYLLGAPAQDAEFEEVKDEAEDPTMELFGEGDAP